MLRPHPLNVMLSLKTIVVKLVNLKTKSYAKKLSMSNTSKRMMLLCLWMLYLRRHIPIASCYLLTHWTQAWGHGFSHACAAGNCFIHCQSTFLWTDLSSLTLPNKHQIFDMHHLPWLLWYLLLVCESFFNYCFEKKTENSLKVF